MKSSIFVLFLVFSFLSISGPVVPKLSHFQSLAPLGLDSDQEGTDDERALEWDEVETEIILLPFQGLSFHFKKYIHLFDFKSLISKFYLNIYVPPSRL